MPAHPPTPHHARLLSDQELRCPVCRSEDLVGARPRPGAPIDIRCRACGTSWTRTPVL